MRQYNQGIFVPKNPKKYIGASAPVYRSAWELAYMTFLDKHPNVLQWSSEPLKIEYFHPFEKRMARYIPDFLVVYRDKEGRTVGELVEIKPLAETVVEEAKTKQHRYVVEVNRAKWQAAEIWCKKRNLKFRVMTEKDLFGGFRRSRRK